MIQSDDAPKVLWRRVALTIRDRILNGELSRGERMPSGEAIAKEFGVNRMTARRALAELEKEGFLRIRHGDGTYVGNAPIPYPINKRTRFDRNLNAVGVDPSRELLRWWIEPASAEIAAHLRLTEKAPVLAMEIRAMAGGHSIGLGVRYACASRFAGFPDVFAASGSISEALRQFDVPEFFRAPTTVSARLADRREAGILGCSTSQPVLSYIAVDSDNRGDIVAIFKGCFVATFVEMHFEND
ncbi:phosphonate metabolism transcriptional regulator PhnF [Agrobacterium sp. T29]|uniref:phosphonate metabolism transcriptional regulator PhnF n=1 Tax=Agrobacterium sp. T29 TaxID=2580515 RepID=UPI00143D947D|nr:phosphonate metabolism transcriptional regulator PhnF [Agrobacterium sp. T29]